MKEDLQETALRAKASLGIEYNLEGVKDLEQFIEWYRTLSNVTPDDIENSAFFLGAYLGECIIHNYGGEWSTDEELNLVCVRFDEDNCVFPLTKTLKQLQNGKEDSVYEFYKAIPYLFNELKLGK